MPILYYLPKFVSSALGGLVDDALEKSVASNFLARSMEAIRYLSNKGTPRPGKNDIRHRRANWRCGNLGDIVAALVARDRHRERGEDMGVFHFMVWVPRGQRKREDFNVGVVSSRDCTKGSLKGDALTQLILTLRPLFVAFGHAFSLVDRNQFDYQVALVARRFRGTLLGELIDLDKTPNFAWAGFVLLVNLQAHPHKDSRDMKEGFVAMTCFGDFEGGNLVVPKITRRFDFRPGDAFLMRSALLEHHISDFSGLRYSIVLPLHADLEIKKGDLQEDECYFDWEGREAESDPED